MVRTTAVLFLAVHLGLAVAANAQGYNSVTLAWDANAEPDIASYIVYWGSGSRNYERSVNVGNNTQYTINGLQELQTYYFAVRAVNQDGLQSGFSGEVFKAIPANPERVRGSRTRLFWRNSVSGAVASWHMDGNLQTSGGGGRPGGRHRRSRTGRSSGPGTSMPTAIRISSGTTPPRAGSPSGCSPARRCSMPGR